MDYWKIKILGGSHFTTQKKETVERYQERAEITTRTPITVTKFTKVNK